MAALASNCMLLNVIFRDLFVCLIFYNTHSVFRKTVRYNLEVSHRRLVCNCWHMKRFHTECTGTFVTWLL
jgi:hypothetical protein